MPILTGTTLAWSPSRTNTTSMGLGASLFFLSDLGELVPVSDEWFVPLPDGSFVAAGALVLPILPASPFLSLSLGSRVVTLAMGTVRTLVRYRASTSAVTDMP